MSANDTVETRRRDDAALDERDRSAAPLPDDAELCRVEVDQAAEDIGLRPIDRSTGHRSTVVAAVRAGQGSRHAAAPMRGTRDR